MMLMESIIKILQRWLNPGAVERFAESIGIKIPVGTFISSLVMGLVPVGGDQIINLINTQKDWFLKTDAKDIVKRLEASGSGFKFYKDATFTIGGTKFTIKGNDYNENLKVVGAVALFGLFAIWFLKS